MCCIPAGMLWNCSTNSTGKNIGTSKSFAVSSCNYQIKLFLFARDCSHTLKQGGRNKATFEGKVLDGEWVEGQRVQLYCYHKFGLKKPLFTKKVPFSK